MKRLKNFKTFKNSLDNQRIGGEALNENDEHYAPAYWNGRGEEQELFDKLTQKLVPGIGKADTPRGELLRNINTIYYDLYNNGFGNGPFREEWINVRRSVRGNMDNYEALEVFDKFMRGNNYGEFIVDTNTPKHGKVAKALDEIVTAVTRVAAKLDKNN